MHGDASCIWTTGLTLHRIGFWSGASRPCYWLKKYMDDQAKSAVYCAGTQRSTLNKTCGDGHSDALRHTRSTWEKPRIWRRRPAPTSRVACWLHDVGKISVSQKTSFVNPGRWTRKEKKNQCGASIIGRENLAHRSVARSILPVIGTIMKKWTAAAYPDGIGERTFR